MMKALHNLRDRIKKYTIYILCCLSIFISIISIVNLHELRDSQGRDIYDAYYWSLVFYPRDYVICVLEKDFNKEDISNLMIGYKFTSIIGSHSNEGVLLEMYRYNTYCKLRDLYELMSSYENNLQEVKILVNEIIDMQEYCIETFDELSKTVTRKEGSYINWYRSSENGVIEELLRNRFEGI